MRTLTAFTPTVTAGTLNTMFVQLYNQSYWRELMNKFFWQDSDSENEFQQFISEQMLKHPHDNLLRLYNSGQMQFWVSQLFTNNIKSNTSHWFRLNTPISQQKKVQTYIQLTKGENKEPSALDELISKESKVEVELIEECLAEIITEFPRMYAHIKFFRWHYFDRLTYDEIQNRTKRSKKLKVSRRSISVYINQVKDLIIKKIKNRNAN